MYFPLGAVSYAFQGRLNKAAARIAELEATPRGRSYRDAAIRWRLGSLALSLAMKVSFEPAGLEGQVRIASLIGQGVSLIAIGWFYSCQLRGRTVA